MISPACGLICNFCGKEDYDVDFLLCGPAIYICDECVILCAEILRDLRNERAIKEIREESFMEYYGTD